MTHKSDATLPRRQSVAGLQNEIMDNSKHYYHTLSIYANRLTITHPSAVNVLSRRVPCRHITISRHNTLEQQDQQCTFFFCLPRGGVKAGRFMPSLLGSKFTIGRSFFVWARVMEQQKGRGSRRAKYYSMRKDAAG